MQPSAASMILLAVVLDAISLSVALPIMPLRLEIIVSQVYWVGTSFSSPAPSSNPFLLPSPTPSIADPYSSCPSSYFQSELL